MLRIRILSRRFLRNVEMLLSFTQDINTFRGSLEELNNFNEAGRAKLAVLRKCIERLDDYAADANSSELSADVDLHRQQFSR